MHLRFFEGYGNGKPAHLVRSKSKELLADLVDRKGAGRRKLAAARRTPSRYKGGYRPGSKGGSAPCGCRI